MNRFAILERLDDNWPGKFQTSRISFLERELRPFSPEVIDAAVTRVLRTETKWPPTLAVIYQTCASMTRGKVLEGERLYAGGPDPGRPGERFLTVDEAIGELALMRVDHPEAFEPFIAEQDRVSFGDRRTSRAKMELGIHRIYVRGLEACIRSEGRPLVPTQQQML